MSERIILRTGEALVEGTEDYLCAEPEVVIGELDGPVGHALANLIGDQVTVKHAKYTNILMGTVQAAIAHGVLDAVRAGDIPKDKVNDLGIIYSVWLDPSVVNVEELDHAALFAIHREATSKVIRKAMNHEPTIDWLLANQDQVEHYYHQLGLEGNL
jgi:5,6,7,8-tetrahydromethanopterin hydro-lyase